MDYITYKNALICLTGMFVYLKVKEITQSEHSFKSPFYKTRRDRTNDLLKGNDDDGNRLRIPTSITLKQFFINKDDLLIHIKRWPIPSSPKAILIICHGLGEHIARYEHVANEFVKDNVIVYGLDHQGHGRSEGDRIFVKNFDDFVDDVIHVTNIAIQEHPELAKNVFILGHSMGGAIAIKTLLKAQGLYKGAMISAPALLTDPDMIPIWQQNIGKKIGKLVPRLALDPIPPEFISNEKVVVDWYVHDPCNYHGAIQAGIGGEILLAIDYIHAHASEIKLPYMLLHAKGDSVVTVKGSRMFHDKTSSQSKTFIEFEGLQHEIFNDETNRTVIPTAVTWLEAHNA